MESSVLLLSSRFYSRRCRICWPGCPPCPGGPAGCDLMVIWSSHRLHRSPPPFSLFSVFLCPETSHPLLLPELWCIVWCDQNSHDDVISMSQQVGAAASSWVGVLSSWLAGKQFHVTVAKAITSVSLSSGLACVSTSSFDIHVNVKWTLLFRSFY